MNPPITITPKNQGKLLHIAGGSYRVVVSGGQTQGAFAVIEMTVPPGAGPNPHAHPEIDETFYVLEGAVTFENETGKHPAPQGTFVHIPKGGAIHGFKNTSSQTAVLLCTVTPAGLDEFFEAMQTLLVQDGSDADKLPRIKALSEQFGQTLYAPDYFETL